MSKMSVSKQVLITTVGYVACYLEVQLSRNIGLSVKIVIHGSMATMLASRQKMSPINFNVLFVKHSIVSGLIQLCMSIS